MGNLIEIGDMNNWPACYTDADKTAVIAQVEELIERVTGCHWYPKGFDMRLDGNGQDRLVLPLCQNILTIVEIRVCDEELDNSYYAFDHNSVFLNCESAGIGDVEYDYFLRRIQAEGLFPRGINNVRVRGTYGESVPAGIIAAAIILVRWKNDPTTARTTYDSETIGRYSYRLGADQKILTGCKEADDILRHYKRGKPIVMAP